MTEPRRSRWSKRRVRAVAWFSGAATMLASGAAIATTPRGEPESRERAAARPIVERVVIRRIVIVDAPAAAAPPVTVLATPPAAPAPHTTGAS